MEPIEPNTMKSGLVCIVLFLILLFVLAYFLVEIGKQNAEKAKVKEQQFSNLYFQIQGIINEWKENEQSYYYILGLFVRLREIEYKNPEMTEVLENSFLKKYNGEFANLNFK